MPSDADRLKFGLTTLIQRTLGAKIINRIDYLALYPCRVIKQNSDGTLDLIADDPRVGAPTLVPIRYGVPGIKATVPVGSRCYLGFGGGDPSKPIVVDWESGTSLTIVVSSASIKLGGSGSTEALVKGTSFKSALDTVNTAWGTFLTAVSAATTAPQIATAAGPMNTAMTAFVSAIASMLSTVTKTS